MTLILLQATAQYLEHPGDRFYLETITNYAV